VSQSDVVLAGLSEVHGLLDVQEIVDRVCKRVAEIGPYRTVLLSLYFGEDVYIGLEGGEEEIRLRFLETARRSSPAQREKKRERIWRNHRIGDTYACFIPADSTVPFGPSFRASESIDGGEWLPADRLMVFVRGNDGEIRGVLSLDTAVDGKRPDPDNLGPLVTIDRFVKLVGVLIHNRHLAAKLRESEERYAAVVEQGHEGFLIARDGIVVFANRRVGRLIGADPESLVGMPLEEVVAEEPRLHLPGEREGRLLGPEGRSVDVAVRTSTIRFAGQSAVLIAVADITERKRSLAELVRSQKMDSVGTLASGVAHDFNNLLSGILGYASLLKAGNAPPDLVQRYAASIEKAADRASDLTRQLLGIVRDERVQVARFPIGRVLDEVASLLEETIDPAIELEVDLGDRLPQVVGDESQIHQVLLNVCLNARDAMPYGGELRLSAERGELQDWPCVVLKVTDTGSGIDTKTLEKVFDPFFTTKESSGGTGLGLYMAYRVIERHGGTINIDSADGEGTRVEIVLPASLDAGDEEDVEAAPETRETGGVILLVDDEELVRDVCGEMLLGLGYDVVTARDGKEAVEAVRERPDRFAAVVLDIAMPVMNGRDAAPLIRDVAPDLPILFSSGHDIDTALGDTRGLPAARCLKKPYRIEDLRRTLGEMIG